VSLISREFNHIFFNVSLLFKSVSGLLEFLGGIFFVFLDKPKIIQIISKILHYNVFNISNKTISLLVSQASEALDTSIYVFIAIFLLGNGLFKIVLCFGLYFQKRLAFNLGIVFLIALLIYQIVQSFYTFSYTLIFFNVLDSLVILSIWQEYIYLQKSRKFR
jgi:uncharacterized membrane protein